VYDFNTNNSRKCGKGFKLSTARKRPGTPPQSYTASPLHVLIATRHTWTHTARQVDILDLLFPVGWRAELTQVVWCIPTAEMVYWLAEKKLSDRKQTNVIVAYSLH